MINERREYFPALTGLRAVAAAMVVLHHFNPINPARFGWRVHGLVAELHIGVTVFFVLSGFLIGYQYVGGSPVALRTYFANRFARIYPMYFLLTTVTFVLVYGRTLVSNSKQFTEYLLNITFLRGLFEEYLYTGIPQGWSLTVEEMFYVSAPLAFWLIARRRQWLWQLPLLLGVLGVGLVLLCRHQPWHGFLASFNFLFQFTYLGRAVEFFTGIALAWWLRRPASHSVPIRWLTCVGLAGMLLSLGALSLLHGPSVRAFGVMQPTGMFINNVLLPLLGIGPLLWGLVREDTWLSRLLSIRPLLLLGKSSYVFYLIHMGPIRALLHQQLQNAWLTLAVVYGASILLYWLVEEPLNRWLRRLLCRPSATPVLVPAA